MAGVRVGSTGLCSTLSGGMVFGTGLETIRKGKTTEKGEDERAWRHRKTNKKEKIKCRHFTHPHNQDRGAGPGAGSVWHSTVWPRRCERAAPSSHDKGRAPTGRQRVEDLRTNRGERRLTATTHGVLVLPFAFSLTRWMGRMAVAGQVAGVAFLKASGRGRTPRARGSSGSPVRPSQR